MRRTMRTLTVATIIGVLALMITVVAHRSSMSPAPPPPLPPVVSSPPAVEEHRCGLSVLQDAGVTLTWKSAMDPTQSFVRIRVEQKCSDPSTCETVDVVGRALSEEVIVAATVQARGRQTWDLTVGPLQVGGRFRIDVVATYLGEKFLGQRWFLPDRNDNPPFETMKCKCLDLKLVGNCDRFGVVLAQQIVELRAAPTPLPHCTIQSVGGNGHWMAVRDSDLVSAPLLRDAVGLNTFAGNAWAWSPPCLSATPAYITASDALKCFDRLGVKRIALFGDSMMVEAFNALRSILGGGPVRQGKVRGLRVMSFSCPNVSVSFHRGYTTHQGRSQLAAAKVVAQQLASSRAQLMVGNLAVLHWQQNMESLSRWEQHLTTWARFMQAIRNTTIVYAGHTRIQMGRTQGLWPSRTAAFSAAARRLLKNVFYFDPYNMTLSRRESAFDGQHYACYHRYGGVSISIWQLMLKGLCQ